MNPSELFDFAVADNRLATKCIRAVGTGVSAVDMSMLGNDEYASRIMGAFVATEMLVRINHGKPQRLQIALAELLETNGASQSLHKILCKMRLSCSPDTIREAINKEMLQALEEGFKPSRLDMVQLGLDNCGFKNKAGYDQFTVLLLYWITYDDLKAVGFYCEDPTRRLCRTKRTLESVKEEFEDEDNADRKTAEAIIGCKDEDIILLSRYCLDITKYAIDTTDIRPNCEECNEMIENEQYNWWQHNFKSNLGCEVDVFFKPLTEAEKRLGRTPTLFDRNRIVVDNPIHADPNSRKTVVTIASYGKTITDRILANNDGGNDSKGELPVQTLVTPFVSDGSPLIEWLREKSARAAARNDDGGGDDAEQVPQATEEFFLGAFHTDMQVMRMRGKVFRPLMMLFYRTHRKTDGKLRWVLDPSDPIDIGNEMIDTYLAIECAAVDSFKEDFPDEIVTATSVNEHKRMCAQEKSLSMGVLIESRFAVVHFMMRDSEKMGPAGTDLFVSALRLALPLFTASHAPKYTRITCEFLEWYELASEAEKKLFSEFFFTKISPHGKAIWADRAMEWVIMHVRYFLGKHGRKDQEMRLRRTCSTLATRIARRRSQNHFSGPTTSRATPPWNDRERPFSKVFANTYAKCRELRIWNRTFGNEEPNHAFEIPGEGKLSSSILRIFSIGTERAIQYYIAFYLQSRNENARSEDVVSLKLLSSTAKARLGDETTELTIKTSTNVVDLLKVKPFTVPMVKEELRYLRGMYDEIPADVDLNKLERPNLIFLLSEWRAQYYRDFTEMREFHEDLVRAQFEAGAESTMVERTEQLDLPFLALNPAMKDEPEYCN